LLKAPAPLKTPGPFGWQAKAPAPQGADVGQALSPANPNFPYRVFVTFSGPQAQVGEVVAVD
jgi:hypothetical protein